MEVKIGDRVYMIPKEKYEKLCDFIKEKIKGFKVINVVKMNKDNKGSVENSDELANKFI